MASKDELMVSCLMRSEIRDKIIKKVPSYWTKGIVFGHPLEISGCQYPCVVMVMESAASDVIAAQVELIMSRATTSLYIIVDNAELMINHSSNLEQTQPEKREVTRILMKFFVEEATGCNREFVP